MDKQSARQYLPAAAATDVGKEILRDLGQDAIIESPGSGDDAASVAVATAVAAELSRRYGTGELGV